MRRPPAGSRPVLAWSRIVGTAAAGVIGAGLATGGVGPFASGSPVHASDARPASHVVDIRGLRFEPREHVVAPGDTIVWVNHDLVPHTVAAADSSWSSGGLTTDGSWRMVVGTESGIPYYCEYHPTMRGRIRVR